MDLMKKVWGRDDLRRSRFHDEKGQPVGPRALIELPASVAVRIAQQLTDRPYLPWVPFPVIARFRKILSPQSRVLEFGSGRSTQWLAAHAGSVVSIESDREWHAKMSTVMDASGVGNVDYRLRQGEGYFDLSDVEGEFDLVIVDGIERDRCIEAALGRVAPGGYLYLDNTDKDMTIPGGDLRLAELRLHKAAVAWGVQVEFFLGYPPRNPVPSEGALVQRPRPGETPRRFRPRTRMQWM